MEQVEAVKAKWNKTRCTADNFGAYVHLSFCGPSMKAALRSLYLHRLCINGILRQTSVELPTQLATCHESSVTYHWRLLFPAVAYSLIAGLSLRFWCQITVGLGKIVLFAVLSVDADAGAVSLSRANRLLRARRSSSSKSIHAKATCSWN